MEILGTTSSRHHVGDHPDTAFDRQADGYVAGLRSSLAFLRLIPAPFHAEIRDQKSAQKGMISRYRWFISMRCLRKKMQAQPVDLLDPRLLFTSTLARTALTKGSAPSPC